MNTRNEKFQQDLQTMKIIESVMVLEKRVSKIETNNVWLKRTGLYTAALISAVFVKIVFFTT